MFFPLIILSIFLEICQQKLASWKHPFSDGNFCSIRHQISVIGKSCCSLFFFHKSQLLRGKLRISLLFQWVLTGSAAVIRCIWSWASVSTSMKAEILAICWSEEFRCVLTQCRGEKVSAVIFEIQQLEPINLGSVTRPFPNNVKSIVRWSFFQLLSCFPGFTAVDRTIIILRNQEGDFSHVILRKTINTHDSCQSSQECPNKFPA